MNICILEKGTPEAVFFYRGDLLVSGGHSNDNNSFILELLDINDNLDIQKYDFNYKSEEIEILKKVSQWPKCIDLTTKNLEPHRIPVYLYELSSLFHSYWNLGKDNKSFRFINENKQIDNSRLVFLKVISIVIKSGMKIVGVDTPEKM